MYVRTAQTGMCVLKTRIFAAKKGMNACKAQVQELVDSLLAAFDDRVDSLDWMTPATRAKAKAKLANIRFGVGYPETWRDYSTLETRADDAAGNRDRAEEHGYQHQIAKLDQPVDRNAWWMTPQIVNALNLLLQNALNFPAAILEAPHFHPDVDSGRVGGPSRPEAFAAHECANFAGGPLLRIHALAAFAHPCTAQDAGSDRRMTRQGTIAAGRR